MNKKPLFAVLRRDKEPPESFPDLWVTVTGVYEDQERANEEAERLNALNGHKDVVYYVQTTRLKE